ncbi:MAG: hypothetical protein IPK50_07005 [Fibrobacterota bacterium]|nr:MAG: hypothetical protein IPK50_07005 [Fibrobacterota bacterium]
METKRHGVAPVMGWAALLTALLVGAGFDCSKAVHPVEARICSDPILSRLDDSLAFVWKSTLSAFGSSRHQALRREQKEWMSELRREAPQVPELRLAWRHRLRELSLKRSTKDLRTLVGALRKVGAVRLENNGSCGRMDFETGEPVEGAAADILELSILPGSGRLHFQLMSGMDQSQCHSCEVESDVPGAKSSRRPWSTGTDDSHASGALSIFADSIVVEISDHNPSFQCGIGASLATTYIFQRHSLRLASPPDEP